MVNITKERIERTLFSFLTDDGLKKKNMHQITTGEAKSQIHKRQLHIISKQRQINFLSKRRVVDEESKKVIEQLRLEVIELAIVINEFKEVFFDKGYILEDSIEYTNWIKKYIPVLPFEESIEFRRLQAYDALEKIYKEESNTVLDFIEDLLAREIEANQALSILEGILNARGYEKRKIPKTSKKQALVEA